MVFPQVGWLDQQCQSSEGRMKGLNWIVQCFTSRPTQYRLYGRRFLQVQRPNQQYQSTEGSYKGKQHKEQRKHKIHLHRHTKKVEKKYNTASPLVYNNMGWLGDGSHRGQGCQAWTVVGLPPWYPIHHSWCGIMTGWYIAMQKTTDTEHSLEISTYFW